MHRITLLGTLLAAAACSASPPPDPPLPVASYWTEGLAEVSTYDLIQSRYGEDRPGTAILLYVTEEFLPRSQVKYEGKDTLDTPVPVLKLNAWRRFVTGSYDYSTMRSVFLRTDAAATGSRALKVSASLQDWCGQTWLQVNRRRGGFLWTGHSYWQAEADAQGWLDDCVLEDELWNLLRMDPERLPVGPLQVARSVIDSRMNHHDLAVEPAAASLSGASGGRRTYELTYDSGRRLRLTFRAAAPYEIESFEEWQGDTRQCLAVRRATRRLDYWNQKSRSFESVREELGLPGS